MAAQAKVIIKGQNDIGSAVKAAAADLGGLRGAADKLGGALKTALSVTAIIASVKMLGSAVAGCHREPELADARGQGRHRGDGRRARGPGQER
jgi:hypothetical protein